MTKPYDISLVNFFIFNSLFGPKEGEEHKRILFYYPDSIELDTKIKHVGLCEAVIKFTQTFTDKHCEALHTQKTRQLLYQPEEHFCLVMTVSIPCSPKTKDGQQFLEYHEDHVQNSVYEILLKQAYSMFKLFNGSFCDILKKGSVLGLKQKLSSFYTKYLAGRKLGQADILDVFGGIHFLPLDKNMYLRIQCLTNLMEATFPQIKYSVFLYNDQLVWSGLEQEDMRILYRYLTTSLFPPCMEQDLKGMSSSGSSLNTSGSSSQYGRFILGPKNLNDDKPVKVPQVFIQTETSGCHLLAYRSLSATVCLLVDGNTNLTLDYLRKIDKFLGSELGSLASDISEQYPKKTTGGDIQFKYVYFNHMNLAQKTTVHTEGKKPSSVNIPADILRLISTLNTDLNSTDAVEDGEIVMKTTSDCWVVGKKSDQREFYVVLSQKNANLIEINDEVKKLCAAHFSNIFFLD